MVRSEKSSFTPTVKLLHHFPTRCFIYHTEARSASSNPKLCGIHTQTDTHWLVFKPDQEGEGHRSPSEGLSGSARQSVRLSPCWRLAPSLSAFNCLFNGLSSSTVALLWELDCSRVSVFLPDTAHQRDRSRASTPTTSNLLFVVITGTRLNRYIQFWLKGEFCISTIPSHWKTLVWPLFTVIIASVCVSTSPFPLSWYCKLQFTHSIMSTYISALQSHQTMSVDVKFLQNYTLSSQKNVIHSYIQCSIHINKCYTALKTEINWGH